MHETFFWDADVAAVAVFLVVVWYLQSGQLLDMSSGM